MRAVRIVGALCVVACGSVTDTTLRDRTDGGSGGSESTGGRRASGGAPQAGTGGTSGGGTSDGGAGAWEAGGVGAGALASGGASGGDANGGGRPGCPTTRLDLAQSPLDMYVMFDQSQSLNEPLPPPSTGNWWDAARNGFAAFTGVQQVTGVGVGLQFFPLDGVAPASCNAAYSTPEVPIAALPGNAAALRAAFARRGPTTFTPTGPALAGAIAHLKARSAEGRAQAVVLVTDGFPTECEPRTISDIAALAGAAYETEPRVATYLVAINVGTGKEELHTIARAGGTSGAYFVDSGDIERQLAEALTAIASTGTCRFELPSPAPGTVFEPTYVNIEYTARDSDEPVTLLLVESASDCVDYPEAWYYDDPESPRAVHLCSRSCALANERDYYLATGCRPRVP